MSLGSFARAGRDRAGSASRGICDSPAILFGVVELPLPQLLGQAAVRADTPRGRYCWYSAASSSSAWPVPTSTAATACASSSAPSRRAAGAWFRASGAIIGGRRRPLDSARCAAAPCIGRGTGQAGRARKDAPASGFRIEIGATRRHAIARVVLEARPVKYPRGPATSASSGPLSGATVRLIPSRLICRRYSAPLRLPVVGAGGQGSVSMRSNVYADRMRIGVDRPIVDVRPPAPARSSSDRMLPAAT